MKRTLPLLLIIMLLLCACGSKDEQGILQPAVQITAPPAPTSEPAPAATPEPETVEIYDAFSKVGYYRDDIGNTWQYTLRIPAIRASGTDALTLNDRIYNDLYPSIKDALDCMAGNYSLIVSSVDYTIHIHDQLISIVAQVSTDWGFDAYYVYCFDAATRTIVDRAALLARYGMTEQDFYTKGSEIVERYFTEHFSNVPRDDFWNDRYYKSTALDNFKTDCQVYPDDNGDLHMIVKLYSFAGGDYYYHDMPLN